MNSKGACRCPAPGARKSAGSPWKRVLPGLVLGLALAVGPAGCRVLRPLAAPFVPGTSKYASNFSEAELRDKLDSFYTDFAGSIDSAASAAAAGTADLALRQKIIQGKLRIVRDCRNAVSQRNPMAAFLDTWALCIQVQNYFETDPNANELGDLKAGFLQTERTLRDNIRDLGKLFLSPDRLAETERKLVEFARKNPLSPNRDIVQPSEDVKQGIPEFGWLLNLPLSPFRALEGVNETARSVRELTVVADRFTRNAQDLPRDAAWEGELLLLKTRSEMAEMLAQVDRQETNLVTALGQARLTMMEISNVLERVGPVASSCERTATAAAQAGAAWDATLKTYLQMMRELYPPKHEMPASTNPAARHFDILDYARTAEGIGAAASEVRQALVESQKLIREKELGARMGEVEGTAKAAIDRASTSATALVDHVFWRAVQLIGVALLAALIHRLVASRMQRKAKASEGGQAK